MSRPLAKDASNGNFGFVRAAAVVPALSLGDPEENARTVIRCAKEAARGGASLIVFPELTLTGYTLGDLFRQEVIQRTALESLGAIVKASRNIRAVVTV